MQISDLNQSLQFGADDVLAIEINGVTYKLTGATLTTALKAIGNFVKSTGDTMTGSLVLSGGATYNKKSSVADVTVNPSSNQYISHYALDDKNDKRIAQIDAAQYTNGQTALRLLIYNYDNSGTRTALDGIYIYATRTGTITYAVANPTAFRTAINTPANPVQYIFTAASGVTISRNNSVIIGKHVFVSTLIQTSAAISGAATTLLNLPSGNTIVRTSDLTALALNDPAQYALVGANNIVRSNMTSSVTMPAGYYNVTGIFELT